MPAWRLWIMVGRMGLRTKIMGIVVGVVMIFGLGATTLVNHAFQSSLHEQLKKQANVVGRDLAARSTDPLLTSDDFVLYALLRDVVLNNEDVRYAFIQDGAGQVIVHTFSGGFPLDLMQANRAHTNSPRLQILTTDEGPVWDVAAPILGGRAGTARVGFSERRLHASVDAVTNSLLLITVFASVIATFAAVFLTWVLTRPLRQLEDVTHAVARGNLDVRASVWANDEIGRLSAAFNAMIDELRQAKERNEKATKELLHKEEARSQLLTQVITAQEEERRRIARELHDQTGQALTSLMVGLKLAEGEGDPDETRQRIREVRDLASRTLQDVRSIAWELRPALLDDLGLVAAIDRYLTWYGEQHSLEVDVEATGFKNNGRLASSIEVTLYRIIQESLTNVVRHAGATRVSVVLERRVDEVVAVVEDDGQGFDVESVLHGSNAVSHLGLYGMQERALLVGGAVLIESSRGLGTTVRVAIPLNGAKNWQADDQP